MTAKPQAAQMSQAAMHAAAPGAIRGLNLNPTQLAKEIATTSYGAKEFGALARNPDVTHKDVINTVAQAVADGISTPTQAVQVLSQVPQDPDQLKPWLDQKYAMALTLNVHLKAAAMGGAPAAPPQAPMAPQSPMAPQGMPMGNNAAPAPGNAPEPVPTAGT
jgi:hypothetical protein